jgi:hypothetical protein
MDNERENLEECSWSAFDVTMHESVIFVREIASSINKVTYLGLGIPVQNGGHVN